MAANTCAAAVRRSLGYALHERTYKAVYRRVNQLGLDITHWFVGGRQKGKSLAEALVRGGYTNRTVLKRRLIKAGVLRNECYECGQQPTWRGKPLVLVLDHINGVNDDYTPENLRLLCPNCNSQTPTFCGRNMKKRSRSPDNSTHQVRERRPVYAATNLAERSARYFLFG